MARGNSEADTGILIPARFTVGPTPDDEAWFQYTGDIWLAEDRDDESVSWLSVRRGDELFGSLSLVDSVERALERDDSLHRSAIKGPFFKAEGEALYLESMFVFPELRGQGAFAAMIDYLRSLDRPIVAWFVNYRLLEHFDRYRPPAG